MLALDIKKNAVTPLLLPPPLSFADSAALVQADEIKVLQRLRQSPLILAGYELAHFHNECSLCTEREAGSNQQQRGSI